MKKNARVLLDIENMVRGRSIFGCFIWKARGRADQSGV